jgi:hypothetical protein
VQQTLVALGPEDELSPLQNDAGDEAGNVGDQWHCCHGSGLKIKGDLKFEKWGRFFVHSSGENSSTKFPQEKMYEKSARAKKNMC